MFDMTGEWHFLGYTPIGCYDEGSDGCDPKRMFLVKTEFKKPNRYNPTLTPYKVYEERRGKCKAKYE